jgi:L-2-hydroxyglutarate oxidase LhgO
MSKDKDEEKSFKKMAFKVINTENNIQNKILKLLDKQLQILEDEVNALKFKITHNKMSDVELEVVYESLKTVTDPLPEE